MNVRSAIQWASAALALAALSLGAMPFAFAADTPDPVADAKAFQKFFTDKFPKLKLEDFVNGPYSMNEDLHRQWVGEWAEDDLVGKIGGRALGSAFHRRVDVERKLVHRNQEFRGTHGRHPAHRHQLGG